MSTLLHRELCNKAREVLVPSRAKVLRTPGPLLIRPRQATDSRLKTTFACHLGKIRIEDYLAATPSEPLEKPALLRKVRRIENDPPIWEASGSVQRFKLLLTRMADPEESGQRRRRWAKMMNCRDH